MRSRPMSRCNCQCRRRSSAPVASNCSRLILPPQYPSVARFNSRAAPMGGKPKFEAIVIEGRESYRVLGLYGTWPGLPQSATPRDGGEPAGGEGAAPGREADGVATAPAPLVRARPRPGPVL